MTLPSKEEMCQIYKLYLSIEQVKDERTRRILYIQFCHKYFPKCLDALVKYTPEIDKYMKIMGDIK